MGTLCSSWLRLAEIDYQSGLLGPSPMQQILELCEPPGYPVEPSHPLGVSPLGIASLISDCCPAATACSVYITSRIDRLSLGTVSWRDTPAAGAAERRDCAGYMQPFSPLCCCRGCRHLPPIPDERSWCTGAGAARLLAFARGHELPHRKLHALRRRRIDRPIPADF